MSLLFHVVHPYKQQCSWLSRFIKQTCSWLTWSWFTGALCLCCLGHMVWNPTPSLSQKVGVWTQLFIPLSLWPSLDWMNASCFNMNIEKEEPFWKNIQPTALNRSTNIEAPSFCQIRHSRDSRDSKLEKLRITLFSDFFPGDLSLYTILKGEKKSKDCEVLRARFLGNRQSRISSADLVWTKKPDGQIDTYESARNGQLLLGVESALFLSRNNLWLTKWGSVGGKSVGHRFLGAWELVCSTRF